jgi:hypothetical protein
MLACDRQLQHRSGLAFHQLRELQNLPIGEFQRVVLNVRITQLDLAKARDLVIDAGVAKETEGAVVPDLIVEGQFRPWQETNGHLGRRVMDHELGTVLPDGGKAASA